MRTPVQPKAAKAETGAFSAEWTASVVFNGIATRWGLLTLATLDDGPQRFHLLRDRIAGISEKMLSQTLKTLVRDGLVRRLVEPTKPPSVTYELTAIGGELAGPLREVIERLGRRVPDILAAQLAYDTQG